MATARHPLLSSNQKLSTTCVSVGLKSEDAPVLIEIKEEKQPRVDEALVALENAVDLLDRKDPGASIRFRYDCSSRRGRIALGIGISVSLLCTIAGACLVGVTSKESGSGEAHPGSVAMLTLSGVSLLLLSIFGYAERKCNPPNADAFPDLMSNEAKNMGSYLQTINTVMGVETISVEGGRWSKENSATLFVNARNIQKSLSAKADLLEQRESTEKCILSNILMIEKNIASIIADYAVCPRR